MICNIPNTCSDSCRSSEMSCHCLDRRPIYHCLDRRFPGVDPRLEFRSFRCRNLHKCVIACTCVKAMHASEVGTVSPILPPHLPTCARGFLQFCNLHISSPNNVTQSIRNQVLSCFSDVDEVWGDHEPKKVLVA